MDSTLLDLPEDEFEPPHCPNPRCRHHRRPAGWHWVRDGWHRRRFPPLRVQRFRCRRCGRRFSSQSFRSTYWLKRPDLQPVIFERMLECACYRQLARGLGVAHSTVLNQVRRLGRHCLLFEQVHGPDGPPGEALVLDGLRSYAWSQYCPLDLNHVVGSESHYVYGFNVAPLRRSGTMTPRQKRRRAELEQLHGRPDPQATRRQVERLLRRVTGGPCSLTLHSDEQGAYRQALRRMEGWTVDHLCTSSKAPRTPRNPLWPVNLLDLLVRHGSANHKRETIAFSKRDQAVHHRESIFQVWRNWVKGLSEREGADSPSPAMRLGLAERRLTVREVLGRRLFPSRVELDEELEEAYWERIPTRHLPRLRSHELSYAA
jgi:transposase-like protein